jgi:hypothetical protein
MAATSFKGRYFQHDMILQSVRWYLAYALSYRDIEELMHERGFSVDHRTPFKESPVAPISHCGVRNVYVAMAPVNRKIARLKVRIVKEDDHLAVSPQSSLYTDPLS